MNLVFVCGFACILFSFIIVGMTLKNPMAMLHEYAPEVQARFLAENPDFDVKKPNGKTIAVMKIFMTIFFVVLLTGLAYFSGARNFLDGVIHTYTIWFVVNLFDVVVLDLGVFMKWRRVRLPGTEDMDAAYASHGDKCIKDGIFGAVIGIPIAFICGWLLSLWLG